MIFVTLIVLNAICIAIGWHSRGLFDSWREARRPSGIITSRESLTQDEVQRLIDTWRELRSDADAYKVNYLCPGQEYPAIGTVPDSETGMWWQEIRDRVTRLLRRKP